ncbi:MAG: hypothetical protein ACR2RV_01010, partial [Verrucomicrobiales bacterium]
MTSPKNLLPLALLAAMLSAVSAEDTVLLPEGAPCDFLVPSVENGGSSLGLSWVGPAAPANIENWMGGMTGIGYDNDPTYLPLIATDVKALMDDLHATIYLRLAFTIADEDQLAAVRSLSLNVRSDDGFIAYLNGARVADRNPPEGEPDWDSEAPQTTGDTVAAQLTPFDISNFVGELVVGENLLALHGLNAGSGSSDFLISPELVASDIE